jgi:hypothetical protein
MRKYMVDLAFVTDSLDLNGVIEGLKQHLETTLEASVLINIRGGGVKQLSEQGYKVYRARTTGQTCAMVGDGHVSKIAEDEAVEV